MAARRPVDHLILGHSHVGCIVRALADDPRDDVVAVNVGRAESGAERGLPEGARIKDYVASLGLAPRVVTLSFGGNWHNGLGIAEHPEPLWIGPIAQDGSSAGRRVITRNMMRAACAQTMTSLFRQASRVYALFPDAQRQYFAPPPPISDWSHIARNPGAFRRRIAAAPPPAVVRQRLYAIQTDVLAEFAAGAGAAFITPPPQTIDADGMLTSAYFNDDPTHGNAQYGRLLLDRIIATARKEAA